MKVEEEKLNINYDRSLVEFINANRPPVMRKRPKGFGVTADEYAAMDDDLTVGRARELLNQMVDDGILVKEQMRMPSHTGSTPYVYYKPESE